MQDIEALLPPASPFHDAPANATEAWHVPLRWRRAVLDFFQSVSTLTQFHDYGL